MREDLKGQTLTFTEIAKLVGENWQNLGRAEKEPFERQANEAKEKYNHDLTEYKKTQECMKYNEYLREFRKRQAAQTQGIQLHQSHGICPMANQDLEKDAAKRLKTDAESARGSSTSGGSMGPSRTTSGTGSGSESQQGSEPPPSRQQRLGSIASMSTAGTSYLDDTLTSPILLAQEESNSGRRRGLSSPHPRDAPILPTSHRSGWADGQGVTGDGPGNGASWLDSRIAPPNISQSPEVSVLGIHSGYAGQSSRTNRMSRGSGSSGSASFSQPPSLKHEQSSHGSTSSASSHPPRTPSDASLPIHALLSSRPEPPAPSYIQAPPAPIMNGQISQVPLTLYPTQHSRLPGSFHGSPRFSNSPSSLVPGSRGNHSGTTPGLAHEVMASSPSEPNSSWTAKQTGNSETGLDGISALLRAREIVDRRG